MLRHILLVAVIGLAAPAAVACSCVGGGTLQQRVAAADEAFVGRVEKIVEEGRLGSGRALHWGPGYGRKISLRVIKPLKGGNDVVDVWTGWGGGDCGIDFHPGMTYLVMASDMGTHLITALCGGTRWLGCDWNGELREITGMDLPDPEPYDINVGCVVRPVLIGARHPDIQSGDSFPVDMIIGRDGTVEHFEFTEGRQNCTACCEQKRADLAREVPFWRFEPATLNGRPVAVRIRSLGRFTIPSTADVR